LWKGSTSGVFTMYVIVRYGLVFTALDP
jgi:hypothetical protein